MPTTTPTPTRKMSVRPYKSADRSSIRTLCAKTVLPFLPLVTDPRLAPMLYADSYLDLEPDSCFVATGTDGQIVGYTLGATDTRSFRERELVYYRRRIFSFIAHHIRATALGRYRRLQSQRIRVSWFMSVLLGTYAFRELPRDVDLERFPAHGHLQIAPDYREGRTGVALMRRLQSSFKKRGVPGQHASVVEPVGGGGYSRLAKALGFRQIRETPFRGTSATHAEDNRDWVHRILVCDYTG